MKKVAFTTTLGLYVAVCMSQLTAAERKPSPLKVAQPHTAPAALKTETKPISSAEPYEFRGAKLGMDLTAFKALPYPDKDDPSRISVDVELHCSDTDYEDYLANVHIPKAMKSGGGIICRYLAPPNKARYTFSWESAYVMVGTAGTDEVAYMFYPDDVGAPRLGDIVISMNNTTFDRLAAALIGKLGSPLNSETKDLQNGVGNHFASQELTWDNGVSTVELHQRSSKIDIMSLVYTHKALRATFAVKQAAAEEPAKL